MASAPSKQLLPLLHDDEATPRQQRLLTNEAAAEAAAAAAWTACAWGDEGAAATDDDDAMEAAQFMPPSFAANGCAGMRSGYFPRAIACYVLLRFEPLLLGSCRGLPRGLGRRVQVAPNGRI